MKDKIAMLDITESTKGKGDNSTLLNFSAEGIKPIYAQEILATYLLMEWPLVGTDQDALRCYGMLLPHGKVHALEVFFLRQKEKETLVGEYQGTAKVFTVVIPENKYSPEFDDEISEMTWAKVCGYAPN